MQKSYDLKLLLIFLLPFIQNCTDSLPNSPATSAPSVSSSLPTTNTPPATNTPPISPIPENQATVWNGDRITLSPSVQDFLSATVTFTGPGIGQPISLYIQGPSGGGPSQVDSFTLGGNPLVPEGQSRLITVTVQVNAPGSPAGFVLQTGQIVTDIGTGGSTAITINMGNQ